MTTEHPLIKKYREFSPGSELAAEQAAGVFPGGDTRASAHYAPYPLFIDRASGCLMQDIDGHEITDFMNNFTSLIHGHAFEPVVKAVQKQTGRGSAYAAPSQEQVELGRLLIDRIPSLELVRFTSSGTEGTQMAIRCARAATGRQKIMKMEGGYHGSYELAEVSLIPRPNECGSLEAPVSLPVDGSFPQSVLQDTIICPYNEIDHGDELAAVIVEPVLGSMGMVPATAEFLQTLRDETAARGIVLIFDEVITLRLGIGGAQGELGIIPDLTCMGKIIGGGLPVGALGGKRELMELFSPRQEQPVMHASTFSGNALTMAAGLEAMKAYTEEQVERVNQLGARLRTGFDRTFQDAGIHGQALGAGSLCNLHLTPGFLSNARETLNGQIAAGTIVRLVHLGMLRRGFFSATRLMYCVSTVMSEREIDSAIAALASTLDELRPYIEDERPNLLA